MNSPRDKEITLSIDAMGGDNAPLAMIEGAERFLSKGAAVKFLIYGDEAQLTPLLEKRPALKEASELIHTDMVIEGDMKPSIAVRKGRTSSMGLAIRAVADGKAAGVVSAGNTGALMAMSKLALRTLPGIDRPAIVSVLPTMRGSTVVLDLGANPACSGANLFQFAVMGDAFARSVLNLENPSIGILNIGSEDLKGRDAEQNAAELLRNTELPLNFYGFIEGDDLANGTVDIVVTDGFTGNTALKTAEGTAKMCSAFFKEALTGSLLSKFGALLAYRGLKSIKKRIDPRRYNGAMFVGLNGVAVKSHGCADYVSFANALKVAYDLAAHDVNDRIIKEMQQYHEQEEKAAALKAQA